MPDLYSVPADTLRKYKVPAKNKRRITAVGDYDLSFVTDELNDDLIQTGRAYSCEQAYPLRAMFGKADKRLAKRLEQEFKRFCIISLVKPDVPHAPPGAVDMYWHFFILHTVEYADFCKTVWGDIKGDPKYRDHFPSTDQTRRGMLEAYKGTRQLYVDIFGEPKPYKLTGKKGVADALAPRAVWGPGSDTSGDSYSGTIAATDYVA